MRKRQVLSVLAACAVFAGFPNRTVSAGEWRPKERWRGFNISARAVYGWKGEWNEEEFAMIHELGFNFTRVMIDYHYYTKDDDWARIAPEKFAEIDQVVAWGRKHKVHTQLCFSVPPGINYTDKKRSDYRAKEPLINDPAHRKALAGHWAYFARHYKGVPNDEVTFNLFNEPTNGKAFTDEAYGALVREVLAAVHAEDPARFMVADGLLWGKQPVLSLLDTPVGLSLHSYQPSCISHYKASWVAGSENFPLPRWPLMPAYSPLQGLDHPDMQQPFRLRDVPAGKIAIQFDLINRKAQIIVEADGKTLFDRTVEPKPGTPAMTGFVNRSNNQFAARFEKPLEIELKEPCGELRIRVGKGNWVEVSSLTITDAAGHSARLPFSSCWEAYSREVKPLRFKGFGTENNFELADGPVSGREFLRELVFKPWERVLKSGKFMMVGEFAVLNTVPHDVSLAYLEDYLKLFKEYDIGWAMWNFSGGMGILDSKRADVQYEDFHGHKLDRKMLELLQRY